MIARLLSALPRGGRVLRYFLPRVRRHSRELALALVLGTVVAACEVLRPWPLQLVFDHVLLPRADAPRPLGVDLTGVSPLAAVLWSAAALLAVTAAGGLAAYGQTLLLSGTGQRVVALLRRDLFRHLLRLPLTYHSGQRSGDLLVRLTGDVVLLRELLVGGLLDAAAALLTLAGTLGVMLWLEPRLTLAALAVTPLAAVSGTLLSRRIRRAVRKAREREGQLAGQAAEALGAVGALQAYGAGPRAEERYARENRSSLRSGLKAARLEAVLARSLDMTTAAGTAATLALGVWSVQQGRLTAGGLLVFLAYQRALYRPVRQLARLLARAAKAAACGERVIEVLETPAAVADLPGARPAPRLAGEIRLEGVAVAYPRGDVALRDVSLYVPAGATVVVRGPSGAGKSTLASLVPRLLDPSAGRVLLDGEDVRRWTLESLRAQIAVVFQEPALFGLTLRECIALGQPEPTAEQVERAALAAGVTRFAATLPHGLDTVVGERGAQLSGGQRQRVALARALLRDAPILVLDEPLAHLDGASREHALEALRRAARGRTVLLVTHDAEPGLEADLVVTLREGRIVTQPGAGRLQRAAG